MGEVTKALGGGQTIEFRGQRYAITPLTYEGQMFFEQWLERRAWNAALRTKKYLSADEHEKAMGRCQDAVASGKYSFGSKACSDAVRTLVGLKYVIYLSILQSHPEVTESLVDDLFEEKMQEAVAKFDAANSDPNGTPPGEPAPA